VLGEFLGSELVSTNCAGEFRRRCRRAREKWARVAAPEPRMTFHSDRIARLRARALKRSRLNTPAGLLSTEKAEIPLSPRDFFHLWPSAPATHVLRFGRSVRGNGSIVSAARSATRAARNGPVDFGFAFPVSPSSTSRRMASERPGSSSCFAAQASTLSRNCIDKRMAVTGA
jgi:hypothetical protein